MSTFIPGSNNIESLTERMIAILQKVADGWDKEDIKNGLFLSKSQVNEDFKHMYNKLGATGRPHAVAIAMREGLIK